MTLDLWHIIVTTTLEVRLLLDRALPGTLSKATDATLVYPSNAAVRSRLRAELLGKLSELKTGLRTQLSEKDVGMVLLPLVIHIDELVMRRLSADEQTQWALLQRELFELQNGGEVFFEFIQERLNMPDTPLLLFDVLYFCLSDGFAGKFGDEPGRIEQYKRLLVEKIPHPALPQPVSRKRRGKEEAAPGAAVVPVRALWFYVSAILGVAGIIALTALLTNL